MRTLSFRSAAALLAASVGLAGCAYSPYGTGVGVSYGDPYYDRYGYGGYGYGGYGSRYGYSPYYGWHNGYYYPGTGYYVYDRYRNPYYWSDSQRGYWEERLRRYRERNGTMGTDAVWQDFVRDRFGNQSETEGQRVTTQRVTSTDQPQRVRSERVQRRETVRVEQRSDSGQARSDRGTWRRSPQRQDPQQ